MSDTNKTKRRRKPTLKVVEGGLSAFGDFNASEAPDIASFEGSVGYHPCLAEAECFLKALDPAATQFTFQTFDDDQEREDKVLAKILHGTLTEHFAYLEQLNAVRAGAYVTVNETDLAGRRPRTS